MEEISKYLLESSKQENRKSTELYGMNSTNARFNMTYKDTGSGIRKHNECGKEMKLKKILNSIFSGIVGVLLTIGYQHFFAASPSFSFYIDGQEIKLTDNECAELISQREALIEEIDELEEQNKSLANENAKYVETLSDVPIINYQDISLTIEGDTIPINANHSMVTIDGREYLSLELAESLISEDQSMIIKDGIAFIGKVVAEKANLTDQNILDRGEYIGVGYIGKDSYGNTRTDAIINGYYRGRIIYTLDAEYSYLKCTISMSERYGITGNTTIKITADDDTVYVADVNKKTEPYDVEIPINSCKLLTIEFDSDSGFEGCIISNAILYN